MARLEKGELLDEFHPTGTLDDIITSLQEYKKKYGEKFYSLEIENHGYYEYTEYRLVGKRLENDEEYESRINTEQLIIKQQQEAAERRLKVKEDKRRRTIALLEEELRILKSQQ